MTNLINLTPHAIVLNNGMRFEPSGNIARVTTTEKQVAESNGIKLFVTEYGDVENLPNPVDGIAFIVSAMVFNAVKEKYANMRKDVISPLTSGKDVKRDDKGHIVSVEGFNYQF